MANAPATKGFDFPLPVQKQFELGGTLVAGHRRITSPAYLGGAIKSLEKAYVCEGSPVSGVFQAAILEGKQDMLGPMVNATEGTFPIHEQPAPSFQPVARPGTPNPKSAFNLRM